MQFNKELGGRSIMSNRKSVTFDREHYLSKKILTSLALLFLCVIHENTIALDFSIHPVFFNEKKPSMKDKIEDSLIQYHNSIDVLKNDAIAIESIKRDFNVKIIGYTDNSECSGSTCSDISLRRARLIYEWMLAHGVSSSQLLSPEGRGSGDPMSDNKTPYGRSINRRVEFQAIPVSLAH